MSIFSMIKRGRQAAKEHKAKQVEKEKEEEKKVPYRHIPMHAATDALGVGPLAVQEADVRLKILEQNKRRSVMTASGLGMSGHTTPGMMSPGAFSTTRLNSSVSVVSDPAANATPAMPSIPRSHSYNHTGGPSSSESASSQEDPEVDGRVSRGKSKQEASHHRLHPSNTRKPADGQPSGANRARTSTVVFPGAAAGIPPVPALPMELGSRKSSGASTNTAASGASSSSYTAASGASSSTAAEETSFHLGADLDNTNAEGHWEPEGDWAIGTAMGTPPREATTKVAEAESGPESKDSPVRRAHSNSDASMDSLPTPDLAPVPTFPLPKKHVKQQHAEQQYSKQEKANKEHAKPKYYKQTKNQNGGETTGKPWMLASTNIAAGRRDAYISDLKLEEAEKLEMTKTRKPRSRR